MVFETGKSGSGVFSHYTTLPLKEMVGVNSNKTTLRRTQILSLSVLKIFSIYKQSPVLKLNENKNRIGLYIKFLHRLKGLNFLAVSSEHLKITP